MIRLPLAAALAALAAVPFAFAAAEPMDINGTWTGKGTVQRDDTSRPINVTCDMTGHENTDTVGFEGECRALLVMKRPIGATFTIDGDRVTGTYTGSNAGVAQLDGTAQSADQWELTMTFPREINGDNVAHMTIERPDDRTFRIVTRDKMSSGVEVTTSDVTFSRK